MVHGGLGVVGGLARLRQPRSYPAVPLGCAGGSGGCCPCSHDRRRGEQSFRDRDTQTNTRQKRQVETEAGKDTETEIQTEIEKKG